MKKYFLLTVVFLGISSISLAGSQDYSREEDEDYEYNNFSSAVACASDSKQGSNTYLFTFTIKTSDAGENYENDDMAIYVNGKYYGMRTHEQQRTMSTGLIYPHFARDSKTLKLLSGTLRGISDVMTYSFRSHRFSLVQLDDEQFAFSGDLSINQSDFIRMTCTIDGRLNFVLEK